MRKAPNIAAWERYATQIRILREYGLQTWAAFTLGYDHDTLDRVRATLDFALENRFTFAAFNILMPYPDTPLYDRLAREGRLLYDGKWWLHPRLSLQPRLVRAGTDDARRADRGLLRGAQGVQPHPALLWRFSTCKTNMRTCASRPSGSFNPVFRREVFKKHGMRFGHFGS